MKKIEVIVRPELRDKTVAAIKKNGVGGVTIHHVQGQGSEDPPLVGQYFSKDMIICVVDDPKLDDILDSIAKVACTGEKGDGKVFVMAVEDALDICTKKRGTTSI
ncbi:P-II family nitrogen regulator [Nitrosopumilus sp. K4]|uniref:P-II family nitrogen regulator n=1 Tax=Nitrosopumilus sp. K4 TaxID=2795383 RepID=UPI001BABA4E8|nr:P-II family nitrogen regulator [Nitrosopumilus sp. K4]QUC64978.1 P-II family nitrogen regulator [Nitrosopumilus sp. K4]